MLDENFVFVGFFLTLLGGLNYLVDTVKGKTKPNKVTWFLWALAPLVAFSAEIKQGVGLQSLMTFSVGFNPLLIFLFSFFNKKSQWKISLFDIVCGLLSFTGIIFWYLTKSGNIAIVFSIIADGLAAIPTVLKSYSHPETESYKIFLFGALNAFITLLTIKVWTFAHYAFPVYILFICSTLFILIKIQPQKLS